MKRISLKKVFEDFCLELFGKKKNKDIIAIQILGIKKDKSVAGSIFYRPVFKLKKVKK